MKLFQSLWILTDNDAMDVTQIESPSEKSAEPAASSSSSHPVIQPKHGYSNIINLLDYMKGKDPAYYS